MLHAIAQGDAQQIFSSRRIIQLIGHWLFQEKAQWPQKHQLQKLKTINFNSTVT